MRNEGIEKEVTLPIRFAAVVDGLSGVTDLIVRQDRISFKTNAIEAVWSHLQREGCQITDIDIQSKSLLDSLFETTREVD